MRLAVCLIAASAILACAPASDRGMLRTWTLEEAALFPTARGLTRPEDGVLLPDSRLLVADQTHGLVLITADATRPFGRLAEAGYVHAPPDQLAAANGVSLEPDGRHVLIADVYTGAIYRVNVEDESAERIYTHDFGVNAAVSDSTGAVWFTQSTENAAGPEAEARLFDTFNRYLTDGALYRIAPPSSGERAPAQRVLAGLGFANGLIVDEARGQLYLAEMINNRITAYDLSVQSGELTGRRVIASVLAPDNIELDAQGRIWAASPVENAITVIDPETGEAQTVFHAETPVNSQVVAEWRRRSEAREPLLELFTPDLWTPMPGPVTGVIMSPNGGPVYLSGLGDALVRLEQ